MTITATNLTGNKDEAAGGTCTTASITLTANKLHLIFLAAHASSGLGTWSLDGGGLTYTAITSVTFSTIASPQKRIEVFRCMPGSDQTTALTITNTGWAGLQHVQWIVDQFSGMDTSGTNGSGAIVQSNTNRTDSTPTSGSVTLSAFTNSSNMSYGAWCVTDNISITPGSGFSELTEVVGSESPTTSIETQYQLGDFDGAASFAAARYAAVAIEIATATITPPTRRLQTTVSPRRW